MLGIRSLTWTCFFRLPQMRTAVCCCIREITITSQWNCTGDVSGSAMTPDPTLLLLYTGAYTCRQTCPAVHSQMPHSHDGLYRCVAWISPSSLPQCGDSKWWQFSCCGASSCRPDSVSVHRWRATEIHQLHQQTVHTQHRFSTLPGRWGLFWFCVNVRITNKNYFIDPTRLFQCISAFFRIHISIYITISQK